MVLGVTLLSNISVKTYYLNNCQLFAGRDKTCEVINLDSANDDGHFGIKVVPELNMSFTFQLCLKFLTCSQVRDRTLVLYLPAVQRALNAARRCHVVVVFSGQRRSFQLL